MMVAIFFSGSTRRVGCVATNQQFAPCIRTSSFRPWAWHARPGWDTSLSAVCVPTVFTDNTDNLNKRMSQAQFLRPFRLHMRDSSFPSIRLGSRLFRQYICDMWVSADQKVSKHAPLDRMELAHVVSISLQWPGRSCFAVRQRYRSASRQLSGRIPIFVRWVPRYMNQRSKLSW
jgi:hypothetical protein